MRLEKNCMRCYVISIPRKGVQQRVWQRSEFRVSEGNTSMAEVTRKTQAEMVV
jgi:hypothetical protein